MANIALPPYRESALCKKIAANGYDSVAKYSSLEYALALDEGLVDLLEEDVKFKPDLRMENLRMLIGYLSCILGCGGVAYCYYHGLPLEESRWVLTCSITVYFILGITGVFLDLYTVSSAAFYGHKDGTVLHLETEVEDDLETFRIDVKLSRGKSKSCAEGKMKLRHLFTESGKIVGPTLHAFFSKAMLSASKSLKNE